MSKQYTLELQKRIMELEKFTYFCKENNVIQSMSKAGCPYDNAVMERFCKTCKSEFAYINIFSDDQYFDNKTSKYIHLWYNYLRPHTYNNGLSPMKKR